ncbi:MAG: hypothetical protein HDR32_03745 [Treponema sp.]|nr:hypothetical protein [Treponema sp.]
MGFVLPGKLPHTNTRPRRAAVIVLLLCLFVPAAGAESFVGKDILSLDLGYLGTGLRNNGWGLGLSYEAALLPRLAVKGSFSHMTLKPSGSGMTVTTVGLQLEALCYPFARGLDWLYVGGGCGTDFIMYNGNALPDREQSDALITLLGEIGWKQNFFDYVMADAFVGYRLPLNDGDNAFSNKITRKGLRYGIHIKLNLPVILRRIFRRTADSPDRTETDEPADDDGAQPARYAW